MSGTCNWLGTFSGSWVHGGRYDNHNFRRCVDASACWSGKVPLSVWHRLASKGESETELEVDTGSWRSICAVE